MFLDKRHCGVAHGINTVGAIAEVKKEDIAAAFGNDANLAESAINKAREILGTRRDAPEQPSNQ